eukprot:TRINITY_DN26969_c0_g1_i1.p1 TRINITY_DN26969_c0_g1~~TRINITY_DN26969_c0_g1_i1.p1  ORF type:complete len:579 (-),score=118.63 TRINITY_DN26969_c0_g1_i1:41-1777(-)
MLLPAEVQQAVNNIQYQFEHLQRRITELQSENNELKNGVAFDVPGVPAVKVDNYVEEGANQIVQQLVQHKQAPALQKTVTTPLDEGELAWNNKFKALRSSPLSERHSDEEVEEPKGCTGARIANLFYKFNHHGNCTQKLTEGMLFKTLSIFAIAANTVYLGLAGDYNVRNSYKRVMGQPQEEEWTHPDIVFTCWFTLEIVVRLIADQLSFFTNEDQGWNIFDLLLVSESLVTLILSYANGGSSNSRLSFLRIFRVFRLVRVVKVVRSVKALAKLRTMIFAILNSFADLLWALLVVGLIIFVFAIIFMGATSEFYDAIDINNPNQTASAAAVNELFGDIGVTSLSLWSAISGGNDWMTYGEQLQKFSNPMYFGIFQFYIAFCCVGLFNVVTGVFVDSAVCVRTEDEIVAGYFEDLQSTRHAIKVFFADADKDGSGALSWDEFSARLSDPAVIAYFAGLDIDPQEAGILFTIFDADKSNSIQIDELVNGTMKLKGSASKLDLMALMYDFSIQSTKIDNLVKLVENLSHNNKKEERSQLHRSTKDLPRGQVVAPISRAVARPPPKQQLSKLPKSKFVSKLT